MIVVEASRRLLAGQPLYGDTTGRVVRTRGGSPTAPPALAVLYTPLAPLADGDVARIASLGAYVCSLEAILVLVRTGLGRVDRRFVAALTLGVIGSYVFLGAASRKPVDLVGAALCGRRVRNVRDKPVLVGIGIGTAAALRLYPIVLVIPLLLARRWRDAGAVIVVAGIWTLVGILAAGLDQTIEYAHLALALAAVPAPEAIAINASLPMLLYRHDAAAVAAHPRPDRRRSRLGVVTLWFAGRWFARADAGSRLLALGIAIVGMLALLASIGMTT